MNLLNGAWSWGGLAALGVAVPVLIHLLNRMRHRSTPWAAMAFLRSAVLVRSRRIRLEDIWLMLLRCLALALIALALARPTWTGDRAIAGGGDVAALIVVDASYSMQHGQAVTRFDHARERVRHIADSLAAGSPVTLVQLGERPRVLLRNAGFDAERMEEAVQAMEVLPEGLDLERGLEEVVGLVAELEAASRECYLVSDLQALSFASISAQTRSAATAIAAQARFTLVATPGDGGADLAVTALERASGLPRLGATLRLRAQVRNGGGVPSAPSTLTLHANGRAVDRRPVPELAPGESRWVPLFLTCNEAGDLCISAQLAADALAIDDARHLVLAVREQVRVLVVGEDHEHAIGMEVLTTALRPRLAGNDSLQVERCTPAALAARDLGDCDLVFLVDVPALPERAVERLLTFARDGGGLVLFAGERSRLGVEPPLFGDAVALPLRPLAAPTPAGTWSLSAVAGDHPLARLFAELPGNLLAGPQVSGFQACEATAAARPVLELQPGGHPFCALGAIGSGTLVQFAGGLERSWSNWTARPLFPIVVHECLAHLGSQAHEVPLAVGGAQALPLPELPQGIAGRMLDREGGERPVRSAVVDGVVVAELPAPTRPGFHRLLLGEREWALAANVDPAEAAILPAPPAAVREAWEGSGIELLGADEDLLAHIQAGRLGREWWRELLLLALALLLLESWLARRASPPPSVGSAAPRRAVWNGAG